MCWKFEKNHCTDIAFQNEWPYNISFCNVRSTKPHIFSSDSSVLRGSWLRSQLWSPRIFQVRKKEGFLNLGYFGAVGFSLKKSRIHTAYIGEYLHFRYQKRLVIWPFERCAQEYGADNSDFKHIQKSHSFGQPKHSWKSAPGHPSLRAIGVHHAGKLCPPDSRLQGSNAMAVKNALFCWNILFLMLLKFKIKDLYICTSK